MNKIGKKSLTFTPPADVAAEAKWALDQIRSGESDAGILKWAPSILVKHASGPAYIEIPLSHKFTLEDLFPKGKTRDYSEVSWKMAMDLNTRNSMIGGNSQDQSALNQRPGPMQMAAQNQQMQQSIRPPENGYSPNNAILRSNAPSLKPPSIGPKPGMLPSTSPLQPGNAAGMANRMAQGASGVASGAGSMIGGMVGGLFGKKASNPNRGFEVGGITTSDTDTSKKLMKGIMLGGGVLGATTAGLGGISLGASALAAGLGLAGGTGAIATELWKRRQDRKRAEERKKFLDEALGSRRKNAAQLGVKAYVNEGEMKSLSKNLMMASGLGLTGTLAGLGMAGTGAAIGAGGAIAGAGLTGIAALIRRKRLQEKEDQERRELVDAVKRTRGRS